MAYPKNLAYAVSRLAGYSTQVVKVRCLQNESAKPGDVISFDLPANAIVNMDSLRLCGTITSSGGTGASLRHSEGLIRQIMVEAGGQIVSQSGDHLPVLWNALNDIQAGDKQTSRQLYNRAAAISAAPGSHMADVPFFVSQLLGFPASVKPQFVDTSLFPGGSIRISLRLSPATALVLAGTGPHTYDLKNLYMLCQVVDIQDGLYYQLLAERLKTGAIELPFTQIYSFISGDRSQTNASLLFSLSSQSVDMLVGTAIPKSATLTTAAHDAGVKNASYYVRGCESGNTPLVQWKLNNATYPSYGQMSAVDAYTETLNAFGLLNDSVGALNPDLTTATLWEQKYFVSALRLNHNDGDSDSRVLSGYNALGTNGQGEFTWAQTGAAEVDHQLIVFVMTTATIKLGAGRSMAITY